jgi:ABC-type transport system substrate-binding protein
MRPGILVALFGIVIGNLYGLAVTISGVMKPQWEEHPGGNARLLPGTGPFRFVEFKPNEWITLTRNPDY